MVRLPTGGAESNALQMRGSPGSVPTVVFLGDVFSLYVPALEATFVSASLRAGCVRGHVATAVYAGYRTRSPRARADESGLYCVGGRSRVQWTVGAYPGLAAPGDAAPAPSRARPRNLCSDLDCYGGIDRVRVEALGAEENGRGRFRYRLSRFVLCPSGCSAGGEAVVGRKGVCPDGAGKTRRRSKPVGVL